MKKLILTFALCAAFLLAGCSAGDKPAADQTTANSTTTKTTETDSTKNATAAITGVAVCDDYLAKVESCLTKPSVPQATKDAYKQSLEQNRAAWKQAASTAQGKQQLESSCKMAMDAAKPFLETSCK